MSEAFICEGTRTPIGKFGGSLSSVRTDDLAALPLMSLKKKLNKTDWENLEEVFYGNANQAGETNNVHVGGWHMTRMWSQKIAGSLRTKKSARFKNQMMLRFDTVHMNNY